MAIIDEPILDAIARLRRHGTDDADYEAKTSGDKLSSGVWKAVSAFANTNGGTILLGLDEKRGFAPTPHFQTQVILNQFIEGMGDGGNSQAKIVHVPHYTVQRVDVDGEQILAIRIAENAEKDKPCYVFSSGINKGSYKRIDDKCIVLSVTELFEMTNRLAPNLADVGSVPEAAEEDLDDDTVSDIIRYRRTSKALRGVTDRARQMRRLNITDKDGRIRLAGLLAAGIYPQQFFPQFYVDVAVHAGTRKAEPGQPRFLDRQKCEGSIREMVSDAVLATVRNLRTYSIVEGPGRRDVPEIPPEVLREAIANAVLHREYSPLFQGEHVAVDVYSDRVEVTSPGGLWGGKTVENLDDGQSKCRNQTLMQLVESTFLTQEDASVRVIEGQGSGIQFMIREMESHALSRPEFLAANDFFKVTFQRGGTELSMNQDWIRDRVGHDLPIRESAILLEVKRHGDTHVHDIRDRLGYDSDIARADLAHLAYMGLVEEAATDVYRLLEQRPRAVARNPEARELRRSAGGMLLSLVPNDSTITARELAERSGKPLPTVRRLLRALVASGQLEAVGKPQSRSRTYRLPDVKHQDNAE